jgi:hypothetical protein
MQQCFRTGKPPLPPPHTPAHKVLTYIEHHSVCPLVGIVHYDEYLYFPLSLDDYKGRYLYSPGREGLPLHLESLSPESESSLIKLLIRELNENMVSNLDTNPNFSRSAKRPEIHCALREGRVEKALFIGSSNASKLATATAMLGVDTSKIAKGGWKVTSDSVDLLLNDLEEQMSGCPPILLLFCTVWTTQPS